MSHFAMNKYRKTALQSTDATLFNPIPVEHFHIDTGVSSPVDGHATGVENYTAGDIILVAARSVGGGSPNLAGISGGGLTWTEAYSQFDTGGGLQSQLRIWWAHTPTTQSFSCTLTPDTPSTVWQVQYVISRFENAHTTNPIAQVVQGSFASGVSSFALTGQNTTTSVSMGYVFFNRTSNPTLTPPTGYVLQTAPSAALTSYRLAWAVAEPAVNGNPLDFTFDSTTGFNAVQDVILEIRAA